ncbi:pre-mRNA-splicing factor ATP-dependent RNA helicase [Blastocystis sp. subtype 4]|uniref:pre-mRNA-splicing factor ATP-dependent RNA helicase n=1 Tax=Blastocystis sp. subtype 4 TaxID=944170 RepID=UPI000711B18A|nr:pre-mRNA-splicing factor ATP-dependent RNA helicase [Blastocystis sp. subtype 4]KNB43586.1 pre-mRNA-splicing factor ATP-dependent RNA helicase [Blastocystis sp. subtype 4]|eukprot:XP_014527029.1 pre-mRNA-splicing factor ATP-dependent RNA helicase [Blastocystis sp. subtype 4]
MPLQSIRLEFWSTPLPSSHSSSQESASQTPSREESLGRATRGEKRSHSYTGSLTEETPARYGGHSRRNPLLDEDDGFSADFLGMSDADSDDAFYTTEEGQVTENPDSIFTGNSEAFSRMEERYKREMGDRKNPHMSARQSALQFDQEKWENNRLQASGVLTQQGETTEDVNEDRVSLIVSSIRPPFLSGKIQFTRQIEMVSTVKDPTSDFAVLAKKGSETLKSWMKEREKTRVMNKDRFWELNGSKMGKVMGLREVNEKGDGKDKETDAEMEAENSYSGHLTDAAGSSLFSQMKSIQEQREYLPIYSVRDELLSVIRENQVTIIVGETGSGKTTQLTQYLYEEGYATEGMIGCTQPRRVAASSVAKRVADEKGVKLGEEVGYAIRFEDCTSPKTRIKYMTDGILLRESISDHYLENYRVVIMDEAHERSLNTDILFGLMKEILRKRTDLKLIVTSATMNADRFSEFFGYAPIFNIPGRTFHVDTVYLKSPSDDYVDAVVNQILTIHLGWDEGDILVFMTGQSDIECVCELVNERINRLEKKTTPLLMLPMYSLQSASKQSLVFKQTPKGMRKCVVCTNIAETSLTVDGIKYVVDCGYCKLKVFNPAIGMDALVVTPISQANADQRKGRAGRTGPGTCFRMYTEYMYTTQMLQNQIPEIQRTNLGNVILLLKKLGVENLYDFDFMDPPPQENITNSMYQLWILGALTNVGALSDIGDKMVEYPLDPYLQKMMVMAEKLNCTAEIVTIVAMLSVPNIFDRPPEKEEEADNIRANFSIPESDHLTYLNVFLQWKRAQYSKRWCERNYLHARSMMRVRNVRKQLLDLMKQQHIPHVSCGSNWDVVRKCVCSAYFFNAARIKGIGTYINMLTGTPCQLHPTSALYGLGYTPDYIVYHELVMTTKEYMRCVTAVDAQWLAELAPMFFSLKESYLSSLESRKAVKRNKEQMAQEMEEEMKKKQEEEEAKKPKVHKRAENICTFGRSLQRGVQIKSPRRVGL